MAEKGSFDHFGAKILFFYEKKVKVWFWNIKKNKMKNIFSPKWPKKAVLTILELKFLFFIIKMVKVWFWNIKEIR